MEESKKTGFDLKLDRAISIVAIVMSAYHLIACNYNIFQAGQHINLHILFSLIIVFLQAVKIKNGKPTWQSWCMIALLAAIIIRVLLVARRAETPFHCYVCVGVAAMLIFQTVVNIGMCLFVMPVIGLTLPFFSYGGSSLLTLYAAMGVVSGIKKRSPVVRRPGRPLG